MRGKRMWQTLRLFAMLSADKRTRYYKEKKIFRAMGDNCLVMDRKVPLYADLISLGNNVQIASNVHFNTHDVTHLVLNNMPELLKRRNGRRFPEKKGCIEIGDNVFIGSGTSINYDVKIGSNVVIGACSLVTKDVPDNSVVAGVPARVISSFDAFVEKRSADAKERDVFGSEVLSEDSVERLWEAFHSARNGEVRGK